MPGTVLINESLDPSLAASTFVEEAGHHLDTKLNTQDTQGDEGELFRRILSGEKLSPTQVADIRAENDKGIIKVDGKDTPASPSAATRPSASGPRRSPQPRQVSRR